MRNAILAMAAIVAIGCGADPVGGTLELLDRCEPGECGEGLTCMEVRQRCHAEAWTKPCTADLWYGKIEFPMSECVVSGEPGFWTWDCRRTVCVPEWGWPGIPECLEGQGYYPPESRCQDCPPHSEVVGDDPPWCITLAPDADG